MRKQRENEISHIFNTLHNQNNYWHDTYNPKKLITFTLSRK
nr:hypothetical protein [Providencia rettgeri]